MHLKTPRHLTQFTAFLLLGIALLVLAGTGVYQFLKGRFRQTYTIGVLYNAINLSPEDLKVVKFMIDKQVKEINDQGGFAGGTLKIKYLNDGGSRKTAYKVVRETINDENLVAYLGCWSSTRVQALTELVGKAGVAFIGGYSVPEVAKGYNNMFSYETGVKQNAFILHGLLQAKARRVMVIANSGDVYSEALLDELKLMHRSDTRYTIVQEKWYPLRFKLSPDTLQALAEAVKATKTDFVIISAYPVHTSKVLQTLADHQLYIPAFSAFVDIPEIEMEPDAYKQTELYDISVFGIPSVLNLRQQLYRSKNKLEMKPDRKSEFRLGLGGLHADAIGLLKEAAELENHGDPVDMRKKITRGLQHYINGERIYHGWFSDWYFNEEHVLVSEILLGWKPAGSMNLLLAPQQYVISDSAYQPAQVLYTNIDMVELNQVNDVDKTFAARFFLSLSSVSPVNISQLDFSNTVRNENNHQPILALKLLKADSVSGKPTIYNYLYQVSGNFHFKPDLRRYPFDEQQFTISLQTNSAYKPLLMQPASRPRRDTVFDSPGWLYQSNYVGSEEALIVSSNKFINTHRYIPNYQFNFTYVLKRAKVDFFLKTLTPLLAILMITYLSAFIPIREFEALAAIQVTALLSAIALYFSAYKPPSQFASISDNIFIFTYIMITTLIASSILQYWLYSKQTGRREIAQAVGIYERLLFPLIVVVYTVFFIL
ncbi:ABC transporter substrate-binding protein [Adhaeribacter sp. BT258]|uniref:ABC transporter substrate-binding protein n=1 Tax=Adhaeribacter terrigena TaxID=2793070 RepID=A0ABS1C0X6_9BACT|nr:ABC transporter substrate-binding protein [Adhaeribacter terrigena]MBK0403022.1 ABC transporter substrate-binding protein [Adhaeribacter terrigena]